MLLNKLAFNISIPYKNNNNSNNRDYPEMTEQEDHAMVDDMMPVSTPTDQIGSFNFNQPEFPACGRTGSVSSIASSVSNISTNHELNLNSFANHYRLTESFETLLFDTYQEYQTNPTVTPFNETNPPSGVLSNVTKEALRLALERGIDIGIEINNYSLTIIRQKLIQICKTYNQQQIDQTPRTKSISSLNNYPSLNLQTRFPSSQQYPQSESKTPTDGYFSFEASMTSNQSFSSQPLQYPQQIQQQQSHHYGNGLQPSFLQEPVTLGSSEVATPGAVHSPAAEFNIPDGLFNATSNRKRDSLRLKRSGNQASF